MGGRFGQAWLGRVAGLARRAGSTGGVAPVEGLAAVRATGDLWGSALLSGLLWAGVSMQPHAVDVARVAVALVVGLAVPGYLLVALLFPQTDRVDGPERAGLTLVLSFCLLITLVLVLSDVHIRLTPFSVSGSVFLISALLGGGAVVRRLMLPPEQRFRLRAPRSRAFWVLVAATLVLAFTTAQVVGANLAARTVAFYVTGSKGYLQGYPFQIHERQQHPLILHVSDPTPRAFSGTVTASGRRGRRFLDVAVHLRPRSGWSREIVLPAGAPPRREVVRFDLYREGDAKPVRQLWVRYTVVR